MGTRAAAVTEEMFADLEDDEYVEPKYVRLDRPFVYAIVDNETNLPVFMGAVLTME